jgi:hypothetical protein
MKSLALILLAIQASTYCMAVIFSIRVMDKFKIALSIINLAMIVYITWYVLQWGV